MYVELRPHRMHAVHRCVRSIATCVAWPVCVSVCILVLVTTVFSSTETGEPIEVPFGVWTRVGPRNRVSGGVHWRHLPNTIERSVRAVMRPDVTLL